MYFESEVTPLQYSHYELSEAVSEEEIEFQMGLV
jgi:hypothetical protein